MAKEYNYKRRKPTSDDMIAAASIEVGNRPPHAPEAEEAVIGAMMVESECVYPAMEALTEKSFYDPKLRLVFRAHNLRCFVSDSRCKSFTSFAGRFGTFGLRFCKNSVKFQNAKSLRIT